MRLEETGTLAAALGRMMSIECVVGATGTFFHAVKLNASAAFPGAMPSATRTGPCRLTPQHRSFKTYFSSIGGSPDFATG